MGVRIKNDRLLAQSGDGNFTVPADMSWMVKFAAVKVQATGTNGPTGLEVNGVRVYETPSIGTILGELQTLIGGVKKGTDETHPSQVFLTAGQVLKFDNIENYDLDIHISYIERDIPT